MYLGYGINYFVKIFYLFYIIFWIASLFLKELWYHRNPRIKTDGKNMVTIGLKREEKFTLYFS